MTGPDPDVPDEIVRSILIRADLPTVWGLVSEPGWFINDGAYVEHRIETLPDGLSRVTDPVHGTFDVRTDLLDPPHRAVFRWLGGEIGPLGENPANTVEFTLEAQDDGVLLTVRERGFAGITSDAAARRRRYEDNLTGWELELGVARTVAEQRAP